MEPWIRRLRAPALTEADLEPPQISPSGRYYLWSGRYDGNALVWWRPNGGGYTSVLDEAGLYTLEEGLRVVNNPDPHRRDELIPAEVVEALARRVVLSTPPAERRMIGGKFVEPVAPVRRTK